METGRKELFLKIQPVQKGDKSFYIKKKSMSDIFTRFFTKKHSLEYGYKDQNLDLFLNL